jgi:hypothetical protein
MSKIDPDKDQVSREIALQLVMGVLLFCIVGFWGYATFLRHGPNPPNNPNLPAPQITCVCLGCAAVMLVLQFVVPPVVVAMQRKLIARGIWNPSTDKAPISAEELSRMSDDDKLFLLYQRWQFGLSVSSLAGGAFLCAMAYALEGELVSPVVALLLVAMMLLRFPTRSRVERFLVEQGEVLQKERQAF